MLFAVLAMSAGAHASERYDPRLRFRTISTARFDIHFHQGEDASARRLAAIAEQVATELEPRLGRARSRVHVILVDQTDLSNGWATPVPYNLIEIVAAGPRASSMSGSTSDWLRLVFTHEYAHVLHLERSRGWIGAIGRPFGRVPVFYPNLFLPPQIIEGIATHFEGGGMPHEGRPAAGDFRMIRDRAAASGRFPSLSGASNQRIDWPSGLTPYVFGSHFYEYLANRYGPQLLDRLHDETARQIPYFGSRAFRKVYGKSLGDLWSEYVRSANPTTATAAATQLTRHGFYVGAPWHSADGRLFYVVATPHAFPTMMELTSRGPQKVTTQVNATRLGGTAEEIVFDQVDFVRSVALQSDLYAVNPRTGAVRRLTREARAADPDVSADGRTIVGTVQTPGGRALATIAVPSRGDQADPKILLSEPGVDFAAPRWSPDGRTIAAERRELGGASQIVLINAATAVVDRIIREPDTTRSTTPAWSPDGRTLFYASAPGGRPFEIRAVDVAAGGTPRRLVNAGQSAQSPDVSRDGSQLVFVGYTPDGFDLFSMRLANAEWTDVLAPAIEAPVPSPTAAASQVGSASAYSPWRTLAPRFWTPIIETSDDELAIGAATGGFDALGRHSYAGGAAWSSRARPDSFLAYAYDRWRPTFFVDVSDDTDPWQEGTLRTTEFNTGATIRFRRIRRSQALFGSFHAATESFECTACIPAVDADITRRALRAAWILDTSRRYGYSISDEEGFQLTTSAEWTRRALGATGNATAVIVEGRGFVRAGGPHSVFAFRAAGASASGDERVRRRFAPGGSGPQTGSVDFDGDAIGLVRGFESSDLAGRRAVVFNVDYRFPLAWIERGYGTWPLFLRSIHGAVFGDAGAAWESTLRRENRRASAGAEFSSDLVLAYSFPLTAAAGVAWRHDPTGRSNGFAAFARIGTAF